jgi:hypothetical protein
MKTLSATLATAAFLFLLTSCSKRPMPEPSQPETSYHAARIRDTNRAVVYLPRDTMAPQPSAAY